MNRETIIIIDFGSQFTQLIARKVRELGAYSEIINFSKAKKLKKNKFIKGVILSGGPLTVTNKKTPKLDNAILNLGIPILGICYGHQILSRRFLSQFLFGFFLRLACFLRHFLKSVKPLNKQTTKNLKLRKMIGLTRPIIL